MFKILLISIFIFISSDLKASDKLLSEVVNTKNISISDAFKYLIKGYKEDFIERNSEKISFSDKKRLMDYYEPDLCFEIYKGDNELKKDIREATSCLELYLMNGHGTASYYLSLIEFDNKNFKKSIYYYAISKAYGFSVDNKFHVDFLKKTPNFKNFYYIGLEISRAIPILNNDTIKINKNVSKLFDFTINDPLYYEYEKNLNLKFKYELLKNKNLSGFISESIEKEINGKKLLLLSQAKSGDIEALIKYCKGMENKYLSSYCFKAIYHKTKNEYALEEYTLIVNNNPKLLNSVNFKNEIMFLLGMQSKNKKIYHIFKNIVSKEKNISKKTELYLSYNRGRIIKVES